MAYIKKIYEFWNNNEIEINYKGKYGAKGEKRFPKRKPTKEEIAKQNQRNREKYVRRLLKENFRPGDYWCTLKFPAGTRLTTREIKRVLKNFHDRMRRVYKKRGKEYKWIQRLEIGKNGGIHIHLVINRIPDIDLIIQKKWTAGHVYFSHIYEFGGMKKLAEYITKQPDEEIYEQLSMFPEEEQKAFVRCSTSKNLTRPEPKKKEYKKRTLRKQIENGITPTKGYYVDKNSIVFGVNPYTGMSYLHYTEFKIGEGEEDAGEHLYI